MHTYNIEEDRRDDRGKYLKQLLAATIGIALHILVLSATSNNFSGLPWLSLLLTVLISNEFRRRKKLAHASWLYLVGLLVTFFVGQWRYGPSAAFYLLYIVPVVFGILLLEHRAILQLAGLACVLMFGLTTAQIGLIPSLNNVGLYCLFCLTLAGVVYVNAEAISETVLWATDIQKKDTRRAEMFYEQKEQLAQALRDLTHTKANLESTNKKLIEAQRKAEEASQAKSVFLSNMSHELRTPLNVVIGYTSTMLDMPVLYNNQALPDNYRADIKLIKESGYYLLGLISDILDLSKIEAGKLDLHCSPVALSEMAPGIVATCVGLLNDKPVQIRTDYPDNLPLVWADPVRLRQVILNLMSNAIKFTHTGSVTLRASLESENVRISIIDTGIGIPEKSLPHIFDRFEQAEKDTDKHYGGTGLGLDISKRLVRMHGRDLTVQSTVGFGSTFTFTLPLSTIQTPPEADLSKPTNGSITMFTPTDDVVIDTILLIEDETSLRDMMHRALEAHGYMVVDVQDGIQALEMAIGLLPDLIILDISLPSVNGWDLLTMLKENEDTAALPVLVCTASEDEQRAVQLGAASYLRKPFSPDDLLVYTQELLLKSLKQDN